MKILVSRTDRAGDVILTTPIFAELKKAFPKAKISAHIRKYTESIIRLCPNVDNTIIDEKHKSVFALAKAIKREKFTHAILVHPSFKALVATFLAGIPCRIGRASNIWQFLLTNRQVQKRSKNEKHEFQYNLDLIKPIVDTMNYAMDYSRPSLTVNKKAFAYGKRYIQQIGMSKTKPVIIHPGHGGSAHNLSIEQYMEIARELPKKNIPLVVSLGPGEEHLESSFMKQDTANFGIVKNVPDFEKLAGIFQNCSAFIGGSTGPMHLAGAIGLPVVAFFPPQKSMTPVRWGPTAKTQLVIKPQLGICSECSGSCTSCQHYPCMAKIETDTLIEWIVTNRIKN